MRTHKRLIPSETITRLVVAELTHCWFTCEPMPDGNFELTVKEEEANTIRNILHKITRDGVPYTMVLTVKHMTDTYIMEPSFTDERIPAKSTASLAASFEALVKHFFNVK
jgi:hypothetical protein